MLRPPFSQEPIPTNSWDVIVVGAGAAAVSYTHLRAHET